MDEAGPDFLGIGAQKAATNWLWQNLKQHPEIWMPPYKEIHYFDRALQYPSPSYLASPGLGARLLGRAKHDREFRRLFVRSLASSVRHRRWNELRWQLRHFAGRYDDRWYFSLFREGAGKVKGEITPSYSILDESDVRAIHEVLPRLKVIFLMRNPIDRAWSHVRFDWTTGRFAGIDSAARIRAFIDSPLQSLRSDYLRTLDIWGSQFPPGQLLVGFYDDVIGRPAELLTDVHRFLGVTPLGPENGGCAEDRIFSSREREIPEELLVFLARKYRPAIEALSVRFGGHATGWLAEADRILGQ